MRTAWLAGAVLLAVGVACSSSSGSGASGFVQQYCALFEPCCAAAGLSTTGVHCQDLASSATASDGYDAAAGQACLTAAQAEQAAGTFCTTLGDDIPQCSQVFQASGGTAQPGQPCQQDSDCARGAGGGATCFDQFSFVDGGTSQTETCIQTSPGQAGDGPCIGTKNGGETIYSWSGQGSPPTQAVVCDVSAGTTCDGTTQKCVALVAVGQPCTSDGACVPSAYCAFAGTSAQCAARLPDGASCAQAPTGCQTTSTCDAATSTCKPLLDNGAACTTGEQCQSSSCVNGACGGGLADIGLDLICGAK